MTRIYMIRHGTTDWNRQFRYQGQTDIHLNEEGREQARKLAQRLSRISLDAVYASDLNRALETAQIIAGQQKKAVEAVVDKAFREIHFGAWEGLSWQEIEAAYPELTVQWRRTPADIRLPGGESLREVQARTMPALEKLIANHPDQTIALVSHGAVIRTMVCSLLGLELNRIWQLKQDNTSVNLVEVFDGQAILTKFNDTSHL